MDNVQVWSCGGGTQSGAIAVLIGMGKLPTPNICFMTDTGREKSGTWPFVESFIRGLPYVMTDSRRLVSAFALLEALLELHRVNRGYDEEICRDADAAVERALAEYTKEPV